MFMNQRTRIPCCCTWLQKHQTPATNPPPLTPTAGPGRTPAPRTKNEAQTPATNPPSSTHTQQQPPTQPPAVTQQPRSACFPLPQPHPTPCLPLASGHLCGWQWADRALKPLGVFTEVVDGRGLAAVWQGQHIHLCVHVWGGGAQEQQAHDRVKRGTLGSCVLQFAGRERLTPTHASLTHAGHAVARASGPQHTHTTVARLPPWPLHCWLPPPSPPSSHMLRMQAHTHPTATTHSECRLHAHALTCSECRTTHACRRTWMRAAPFTRLTPSGEA